MLCFTIHNSSHGDGHSPPRPCLPYHYVCSDPPSPLFTTKLTSRCYHMCKNSPHLFHVYRISSWKPTPDPNSNPPRAKPRSSPKPSATLAQKQQQRPPVPPLHADGSSRGPAPPPPRRRYLPAPLRARHHALACALVPARRSHQHSVHPRPAHELLRAHAPSPARPFLCLRLRVCSDNNARSWHEY